MKRRVFRILATISLVLCAGLWLLALVGWIASYPWKSVASVGHAIDTPDQWSTSSGYIVSWKGGLAVGYLHLIREGDYAAAVRTRVDPGWHCQIELAQEIKGTPRGSVLPGHPSFLGFQLANRLRNGHESVDKEQCAIVPYWFVVLTLSLTLWLFGVPRLRYRHRAAHGLCLTCGYDLRASKDRCPECGTVIASQVA